MRKSFIGILIHTFLLFGLMGQGSAKLSDEVFVMDNPISTSIIASPVYRFNTHQGGYFYTIEEIEKSTVIQKFPSVTYEGIGFYAFPAQQAGLLPVYRFNNHKGGYLYTIDEAEKSTVIQQYPSFTYEGIGFYAFPTQQAELSPVYRFNTHQGGYLYTIDEAEKNMVIQQYPSVTYEGIAFYAYISAISTSCMATIDKNLFLTIPYLSYVNPLLGSIQLRIDFVYEFNPMFSQLILFKYKNSGIINNTSVLPFSCKASTLSNDMKIHIPEVLLPDGYTHLWMDLEYSTALSNDEKIYFVVTDYGHVSN